MSQMLASKLLQLGEKEMEEKLCSTFASSSRYEGERGRVRDGGRQGEETAERC
jgi:hypothetical protein